MENLTDIDETRRYFCNVYEQLYTFWIAKGSLNNMFYKKLVQLNVHKFTANALGNIDREETKENSISRQEYMKQKFDIFYHKHLKRIRKEIDIKHLQSLDLAFNEQKKTSKVNEDDFISSLSVAWKYIGLKDENKENNDYDLECLLSKKDCLFCQRIIFILKLFNKLFINKYIHLDINNNNDNKYEFIDIFYNLFYKKHKYYIHNLLDDLNHIQKYH